MGTKGYQRIMKIPKQEGQEENVKKHLQRAVTTTTLELALPQVDNHNVTKVMGHLQKIASVSWNPSELEKKNWRKANAIICRGLQKWNKVRNETPRMYKSGCEHCRDKKPILVAGRQWTTTWSACEGTANEMK